MNDIQTDREWQRLLALYEEKADEELLELHERRDDLIELAQQALAKVMQERGLEAAAEPEPELESEEEAVEGRTLRINEDEVYLYDFDSFRASVATEFLDRAEITYRLVVRTYGSGQGMKARSTASIALIVSHEHESRALEVLQSEMRLFPEEEAHPVFPNEGRLDPGPVVEGINVLGEFTKAQAEVIFRALEERGIPYSTDYSQRDRTPVLVSVAAEHLDEAFELMAEIADTLPEE